VRLSFAPGNNSTGKETVILLTYHLTPKDRYHRLTMAAVMHSSDALPREAAATAKTCGFTLLSPLTPKDRYHRLTMAAVMQSSDALPREAVAPAKTCGFTLL